MNEACVGFFSLFKMQLYAFFPPKYVIGYGVYSFTLCNPQTQGSLLGLSQWDFLVLCGSEEDREGSMSFRNPPGALHIPIMLLELKPGLRFG